MIKHLDSPLERVIKQRDYEQHLKRIDHILKRNKTAEHSFEYSARKLYPLHSNNSRRQTQIDKSNQYLHKRLGQIRNRKCDSSGKSQSDRQKGRSFERRQRRRIEEENLKFVDKIISMKCVSSYDKVKREVSQYQKIKSLLKSNKTIKLPSFGPVETRFKTVS